MLALVSMILKGQSIQYQSQPVDNADASASNAISQLLMFNIVKQADAVTKIPLSL